MKKVYFLFFSTIVINYSRAQTSVYYPFPDSNAVWNIYRVGGLISCSGIAFKESFSYTFSGDTAINGSPYHKLFIPFIQRNDTCHFWHTAQGYAGCIRQDVVAKKVFFISPGDTTQYKLYDFNLQVGDTVPIPPSLVCSNFSDTIKSIDSVLIGSNYRKEWNVSSPFISGYSIIEGIGFTTGLLEPCGFIPDGDKWQLSCFQENGVSLYNPNASQSCDVIEYIDNPSDINNTISIYPDPFTDMIVISLNKDMEQGKVSMFNVMGEKVLSEAFRDKQEILNVKLPAGIYFLQVTNGFETFTNKIIRE